MDFTPKFDHVNERFQPHFHPSPLSPLLNFHLYLYPWDAGSLWHWYYLSDPKNFKFDPKICLIFSFNILLPLHPLGNCFQKTWSFCVISRKRRKTSETNPYEQKLSFIQIFPSAYFTDVSWRKTTAVLAVDSIAYSHWPYCSKIPTQQLPRASRASVIRILPL